MQACMSEGARYLGMGVQLTAQIKVLVCITDRRAGAHVLSCSSPAQSECVWQFLLVTFLLIGFHSGFPEPKHTTDSIALT